MAAFQSDASGFLVGGTPLGTDRATKLLSGIKGDTRRILEAMRSLSLERSRSARGGRAPLQMAAGAAYARAVTAGGRAMSSARELARDPVTGRFVSQQREGQPSPTEQRMTRSAEIAAKASQAVAKATEEQRRDEKLKAVTQERGSDGRFGKGKGKGGGGSDGSSGGGGLGGDSRILQAGATAIDGAERIDPLIGAAGEVKQFAQFAKNVATPIIGAGRGLLGRKKQTEEEKEQKTQTGFLKRILKRLSGKGGEDSGGGLMSMLPFVPALLGLLPAVLPAIMAAVPVLLAGAAVAIMAVFKDPIIRLASDALDWATSKVKAGAGAVVDKYNELTGNGPLKTTVTGVEGAIINAANAAGTDSNLALRMARAESGGLKDPYSAKSGTSSAHGIGQITGKTWLGAMRQHGGKYLHTDTSKMTAEEAEQYRTDPQMQLAMMAELVGDAKGAALRFSRRAKVPYEDAQTRAMYMLGGGDGSKFLDAHAKDPKAMLSTVLSDGVIKANPFMEGMTAGDLMARYRKEMASNTASAAGIKRLGNPFKSPLMASQSLTSTPMARAPSSLPDIGPAPSIEGIGSGRVGSATPTPVRVEIPATLGQDVRDRDIAHIATGGIGNAQTRR